MPLPTPGTAVDPACPLDWSHPLNNGLLVDVTIVPGLRRGGLKLHDLVRGGRNPHDGTLTNGPGWRGAKGRPGGFGSIALDGTNDHVVLAGAVTSKTACLWAQWTSSATIRSFLQVGTTHCITTGAAGARVGTTPSTSASAGVQSTASFNDGAWHFICAVRDTNVLYVDGDAVATGVDTNNYGLDASIDIGSRNSAAQFFPLTFDGVQIYNRALTAGEVAALYDETRRGNPERVRWIRPWSLGVTVEAAAPGGATTPRPPAGGVAELALAMWDECGVF